MRYILIILSLFLISCDDDNPYPDKVCPDGCYSHFEIIGDSLDNNGFKHVKFNGLGYFTVKGKLSKLDPYYEVNGVPLIQTDFDSNYWILLDTFQYQTAMYSYLSWYTDKQFNNPISIGNQTYTLQNIAEVHPPLNIAGYQLTPHMCLDCPYTPTLIGTHSKYNYEPKQNFFFDEQMVGDTAYLYIQTTFNNDLGPRVVSNTTIKVIFD